MVAKAVQEAQEVDDGNGGGFTGSGGGYSRSIGGGKDWMLDDRITG